MYLSTLNGLQQNIKPEDLLKTIKENQGFWAGNTIKKFKAEEEESPSGNFARKKDDL